MFSPTRSSSHPRRDVSRSGSGRKGSSAILRIEDTGIGFDRALADRLFEPFIQQEQHIDRFSGGLGLGLSISRKLAELQGGTLSGESPGPGRGAAFTLTLPLATAVGDNRSSS